MTGSGPLTTLLGRVFVTDRRCVSVKIVLAVGHVPSGVTMFAFLRVALGSRPAAFLGGLGFVLTFWHTQHVLIMGRLPLSLFYASTETNDPTQTSPKCYVPHNTLTSGLGSFFSAQSQQELAGASSHNSTNSLVGSRLRRRVFAEAFCTCRFLWSTRRKRPPLSSSCWMGCGVAESALS